MEARVVFPFFDIEADCDRAAGEVFEATEGRIAAINSAGYGKLVEAVEAPEPEKPEAPEPAKPARKPASKAKAASK